MIHSWIVGRLFLVASSAADPDQTCTVTQVPSAPGTPIVARFNHCYRKNLYMPGALR